MSPCLDLSIFPLFLTNNAKFTYDLFSRKTYETPYVGRYVIMEHPTSMKMGISLKNTLCTHVSGYVILEHSIKAAMSLWNTLCRCVLGISLRNTLCRWLCHCGTPYIGGYVIVELPM